MGVDATPPTLGADKSGWFGTATNVTVSSADPESGIAWAQYQWDTNNACSLSGIAYTVPFAIPTGAGSLHTLYLCAKNGAGLQTTVSATMGVDTTGPTVVADKLNWYTSATNVTITSTDAESGIAWTQYQWDTNNACSVAGIVYAGPIAIPTGTGSLHTLYMCTQNGEGVQATASVSMGVDTSVPTVSATKSGWYTAATSVGIISSDPQSGIAWTQYDWDNNDACSAVSGSGPYAYVVPVAIPTSTGGLHTLYMCTQNGAGVQSSASATMAVDTTLPTVSAGSTAGWYAVATNVTITSNDSESGIVWTHYDWDNNDACSGASGSGPYAYSIPIAIPADGAMHTLYMCTQNGAGIQASALATMGIDTSAPTVSANKSGWYPAATSVNITSSDPQSGIAWTHYNWDNNDACNAVSGSGPYAYSSPLAISADANSHILYMCTQNNAGAQASATATMGIDTTAPTVSANKSGWYSVATSVSITSNDAQSGITWTHYDWDNNDACNAVSGSGPYAYGSPIAIAADGISHTLYMCTQNGAGTPASTSASMGVDISAPTVSANKSGWYPGATNVSISSSDLQSGIVWTHYDWNKNDACSAVSGSGPYDYVSPLVIPADGASYTLYMCTQNGAGAQASTSAAMGIDTSGPGALSANNSGWFTVATNVTISSSDPQSGIAWTQYDWDNNDACNVVTGSGPYAYSSPIAIPTGTGSLHTLYMCTQNGAGTPLTATATMAVDTTPPILSADKSGWYTVATNVTITSSDAQSSIAWTHYDWDVNDACNAVTGSGPYAYSSPIAIPTGGGSLHTLYMCTQNGAGTQSFTSATMAVDTAVPDTLLASKSGWHTVATNVTIASSDGESGIVWTHYDWDVNDACNVVSGSGPYAYGSPIAIPAGTGSLHTLYMCTQNAAGLQSSANATMAVDTTPPNLAANKSGWYTAATNVTITSSDPESGLAWTHYDWDVNDACNAVTGSGPYAYGSPLAIPTGTCTPSVCSGTGLHTLYMCAQNGAGTQTSTSATMGIAFTPAIGSFMAAPTAALANTATPIKWTWTYSNSPGQPPTCNIDNGVGSPANGGTTTVNLASQTSYTLTCTNAAPGSGTASTTIWIIQTLASGQVNPWAIAIDTNNVYWTNYVQIGAVMKVQKNGTGVTALWSSQYYPQSIAADGTYVYWTDYDYGATNSSVNSVDTTFNYINVLAYWDYYNPYCPTGVSVDATNVYWADSCDSSWNGSVGSVPIGGGALSIVGTNMPNVFATANYGGSVYSSAGNPSAIAADAGHYYTTDGTNVSKDGSVLASDAGALGIAVDASHIYWANTDGTVKKIPIGGGTVVTLAKGASAAYVAVDATSVYWTDPGAGTVLKLTPK